MYPYLPIPLEDFDWLGIWPDLVRRPVPLSWSVEMSIEYHEKASWMRSEYFKHISNDWNIQWFLEISNGSPNNIWIVQHYHVQTYIQKCSNGISSSVKAHGLQGKSAGKNSVLTLVYLEIYNFADFPIPCDLGYLGCCMRIHEISG